MTKLKMNPSNIRLTQFSHGAGCGCKISPAILEKIIGTSKSQDLFPDLLVGNASRDDAAVMKLNENEVIISTTDFFMPIVDDPFDFGRVASANAISDIYAMGGKPLMAIAILGWPIDKVPIEAAAEVLEGARSICKEAGIPLAGGHSIDCPEPIFGLAVTGTALTINIKTNSGAKAGDYLFLTKPLGAGILSTASKKGLLLHNDLQLLVQTMTKLNSVGAVLSILDGVHALTDVTGFGLLGHLLEICRGSGLSAELDLQNIPILPCINGYLEKGCIPGGTNRNWASYGESVGEISEHTRRILADPQTSGGLLVSVGESSLPLFYELMSREGFNDIKSIGRMVDSTNGSIVIVNE